MMTQIQRYISDELTHFVGKDLPEKEEKYQLLINIVGSGWLTHPPHIQDKKNSGGLSLSPHSLASENEMYSPEVICFCDIPLRDLNIHMDKYSLFGLSFRKLFLIPKGVNPVFYIAKGSYIKSWIDLDNPDKSVNISRSDHFDNMLKLYQDFINHLAIYFKDLFYQSPEVIGSQKLQNEIKQFQSQLFEIERFLDFHIFSFMKFFDSSKKENDPDNYYMEREWRMIGNLNFSIQDIYRVLLPREYAERFRKDIPEYIGQLSFSDPLNP